MPGRADEALAEQPRQAEPEEGQRQAGRHLVGDERLRQEGEDQADQPRRPACRRQTPSSGEPVT